jgi:hypothetical protein
VVIFIKKIWAEICAFLACGISHVERSFCQSKTKQNPVLGYWLPSSWLEPDLELDTDRLSLICRPAPDLGPKISFMGSKRPLVFALTKLEALIPVIFSLSKLNRDQEASKIVIINLSQISSILEQAGTKAHNRVFRQVLVDLHKLGENSGFEILLFEQKELLSNKNGALFERLFMSK